MFVALTIDQIDNVEEAATCAVADESTGNRDGQMALAGSRAADEDDVALVGHKGAGSQFSDQGFIHGRVGKVEVVDILCQRQLSDTELVADGSGLLLGDLRLQEITDDAWRFVLPLMPLPMTSS